MNKDNLFPYTAWCPANCYKSVIICVCSFAGHSFFTPVFSLWNHHGFICVCPDIAVLPAACEGAWLHTMDVVCTQQLCEQMWAAPPWESVWWKRKKNTSLPRRLNTMAEMGLVGIYQIVCRDRRHILLLLFSDNSCALKKYDPAGKEIFKCLV